MKIVGIGAGWCNKCQQAKQFLRDLPVEWVDESNPIGRKIVERWGMNYIPFFIVSFDNGKEYLLESAIGVKQFYENNKSK